MLLLTLIFSSKYDMLTVKNPPKNQIRNFVKFTIRNYVCNGLTDFDKTAIIFLASKNFRHTFSDRKLVIKTDEIGESDNTIEILVSFGFQWWCPFWCTAMQGYLFCQ